MYKNKVTFTKNGFLLQRYVKLQKLVTQPLTMFAKLQSNTGDLHRHEIAR